MRVCYLIVTLLIWVVVATTPSFASSPMEEALIAAKNKNYAKAKEIWLIEAKRGNATAQNDLGIMYENGHGISQDYGEAVNWYSLAAEQGDANAQCNLSVMYFHGRGVGKNVVVGYAWTIIGAANGNYTARDNVEEYRKYMTPLQIESAQALAKEYYARISK